MTMCETCGEQVLEARVDGRAMMVHPEAFFGIKLDQKFPAQTHYISGKVASFYVAHECKPTGAPDGQADGDNRTFSPEPEQADD